MDIISKIQIAVIIVAIFFGLVAIFLLKRKRRKLEKEKAVESEEKPWLLTARVYAASEKKVSIFVSSTEERAWIMEKVIDPIIQDLPKKRLEDAFVEYKDFGKINNLGPYKLNKEQIQNWRIRYAKLKNEEKEREVKELKIQEAKRLEIIRAAEKEKARLAEQNKQKKLEQNQRWERYREDFKKLNKPQQKHELAWFNNIKYLDFTDNQTEKAIYAHELEMIILGGIK